MKILVTGGPVHAKIDAVKMVTNRFKGGLMAKLADEFVDYLDLMDGDEIIYLCAKGSTKPEMLCAPEDLGGDVRTSGPRIVYHDGFHDYREKVKELAADCDAVVLGAAVANLIPVGYSGKVSGPFAPLTPLPLEGKFPSHNYKPGDRITMEWTIAPRVIDEVKACMKPGAHLFGFKLLSGVTHDELVTAAYGVLLESHATAVFANQADVLNCVYMVTKERGVHKMVRGDLSPTILKLCADEYYRTIVNKGRDGLFGIDAETLLAGADRERFVETPEGLVFGTVAVRSQFHGSFLTTARGKRELDETVFVESVDHHKRVVHTLGGKATLNAPLLDVIFKDPRVDRIEHYHDHDPNLRTVPWAPPGTVRDTERLATLKGAFGLSGWQSFNVHNHGCYLLFDKDGHQL